MKNISLRFQGAQYSFDEEWLKKLILTNGQSVFEEDDSCNYGDFIVSNSCDGFSNSLVIVVNEPEGVFLQYQKEPDWKAYALTDNHNKLVGTICDQGGQCKNLPAKYFVRPDKAWNEICFFMKNENWSLSSDWQEFDIRILH